MEDSELEIPSYFLCPISLQMMRDPVALPTGITYDRESIEQWLFAADRHTCPVTKQPLADSSLTPNHTLRRLIQSWCTLNTSLGIQRLPTPRPPVDASQISLLLRDPPNLSSLVKLKKIVSEGERNKRCFEATPGAIDFLAAAVVSNEDVSASDEAISILYALRLSQQKLRNLLEGNQEFLNSLTKILKRSSNYQSRAHVVLLIKALLAEIPRTQLISIEQDLFEEIVKVLRDRISYPATKAALQVIHAVCPWGTNRSKAVKAGAVKAAVELLVEEHERKACEMMMVVLDELCGCAEGRAELVAHAAGLAVVAKKMARVSAVATERAVRVVYSVALNYQESEGVVEEMLQVGVVSKLCMLLQVECCEKSTRKMVKEILSMHFNVWRRSPCLTPRLKALYP